MKRTLMHTLPVGLLMAYALAASAALAQPASDEASQKAAEAARLAEEKAKNQNALADEELAEAKRKAALGQGPIGVPGVKPALTFDEPVRDIGRVTDDAPVPVTFRFTNTSGQTVRITNMSGSCGCTVPVKPAKDIYSPGESGEITATYNPANRRGKEVKHVYVDTDFATSPRVELTFKVDTLARVMVDPQNAFMGEVRRGDTRTQVITITGREPGFDVTDVKLTDAAGAFSVQRLEKAEIADPDGLMLTQIKYQVTLSPSLPLSMYQTNLAFSTTDPKRPNITTRVQASVVGDLRVTPDRVWVAGSQPGQPWVREVRFDHRRGESFWITGIESEGVPDGLKVVYDLTAAPGATGANTGYMFRIAGVIPGVGGALAGKFIVRTTIADQAVIEIPLQGNIQLVAPQQ